MFGIIGSGFGLYGYMPAIVSSSKGASVVLMKKAMPVFEKRPELQFCEHSITWAENDQAFYSSIETLVISVPPFVQLQIVNQCCHLKNIKQVILEKPVAATPFQSLELLNLLEKYNKQTIIGYTLQYTDWASLLKDAVTGNSNLNDKISIKWNFKAHHFRNNMQNWKRSHNSGGGVIRFFGIHIIALLSIMGYTSTTYSHSKGFSEDDIFLWEASFTGNSLPLVNVSINSNATDECFCIDAPLTGIAIKLAEPFENCPKIGNIDKRVGILSMLLNELATMQDQKAYYTKYKKVNDLWQGVEQLNRNTII